MSLKIVGLSNTILDGDVARQFLNVGDAGTALGNRTKI